MAGHGSPDQERVALGDVIKAAEPFARRAERLEIDEGSMAVPPLQRRVVPTEDAGNEASPEGSSPILSVGEQKQVW
ncbi:MAG TPA: hypothetical protein VMR77_00700 [Patescibacteria group bacterium]|jgi:hypothetical protein|nr:hypothetical protein [Patescibacteria group bacterium]